MKNILLFCMSILFFSLTSCTEESIPKEALHGKWIGIEILKGDKPSNRPPSQIQFEFRADSSYTYNIGKQYKEDGTWDIEGTKLLTKTPDRQRIAVRLEMPSSDTVIMHQNRATVKEKWTLVKE